MQIKLVEAKHMKNLEDYLVALVAGLISIKTLESFHVQAINLGVLKEDQACRANTILWDCKRLQRLYMQQADSVLELLPPEISFENIVAHLVKNEIHPSKIITKKSKVKNGTNISTNT